MAILHIIIKFLQQHSNVKRLQNLTYGLDSNPGSSGLDAMTMPTEGSF
jgi:hypothetical protein